MKKFEFPEIDVISFKAEDIMNSVSMIGDDDDMSPILPLNK